MLVLISSVASAQEMPPVKSSIKPGTRITLLQLNDVYQISPVDRGARGGLARVATMRREIMRDSPNTLFVLGGDTLSPSVASTFFQGRQMVDVWNALELDYAVFGNHEFDFGDDVLRERIKESKFAWLGANVVERRTGRPFGGTPPFLLREIGGIRIGLFGVLTPDTAKTSKASSDVMFLSPCETARPIIAEMRKRGAQIIVALTHLTIREDKELAACARDIDLILGGHEHTLLTSLAGRTPILKMGSDARNLGRVDLFISPNGKLESMDWQAIPVTAEIADAPDIKLIIDNYERQLSAELDKTIGTTRVALDARQRANRTMETALGSYVADAFRRSGEIRCRAPKRRQHSLEHNHSGGQTHQARLADDSAVRQSSRKNRNQRQGFASGD
jgi:5'-nucleotidase